MVTEIGKVIRKEVKSLCSDKAASILKESDKSNLVQFTWEKVLAEIQLLAPTLLKLLQTVLEKKNLKSHIPIIGMITSILCHFHRNSVNCVQNIISIILYAGHCSKQVKTYTHTFTL